MGYLDNTGLAHFWENIKSYVGTYVRARRHTGTPYGKCSTGASTVAKTVTVNSDDFALTEGASIRVKFTNSNTATNPTLNVNGTGAKAIRRYGTTAVSTSAATSWNAGAIVDLSYDGTYWYIDGFNNTSYSSMTVTEYEGGSGTSARLITPARLKAAILYWAAEKAHTHDVVSTTADGFAPQLDGSTSKFLRGDGTWAEPPDNNTTYGVVSTTENGLAPKLAGGTTKFLRADGTWAEPPSGGVAPHDYVVEQAGSGYWYYCKWNSGKAECWRNVDFSVNITSAYGSLYYARLWDSLTLPVNLFITAPTITIKSHDTSADTWVVNKAPSKDEIGIASLLAPTTGSRTGIVSVHAIGRWK